MDQAPMNKMEGPMNIGKDTTDFGFLFMEQKPEQKPKKKPRAKRSVVKDVKEGKAAPKTHNIHIIPIDFDKK